jgi:hypothetical protein
MTRMGGGSRAAIGGGRVQTLHRRDRKVLEKNRVRSALIEPDVIHNPVVS